MAQARTESILQKLKAIVPEYIARFIIWYYSEEDKRCDFKDFMPYEPMVKGKSLDDCLEWLTREDAQEAMQTYHKHMKKFRLMQIYDAMFEKAVQGDTNAAKWVEAFSNSSFFDESTDEIDDFMKKVNIPALKGGK
ncbi:MAG: hypothetical protein K0R00_2481 [Herbinix sp.]|jgi:hypothetical protein|nr:hypothetical protein [Herbinix sp.]